MYKDLINPGNATSLEFGDSVTNTITLPSEMIAYTLIGIENDVVDLRMIDISNPDVISEIRLYRPDGTLLCSAWHVYSGLAETACTLDVSGTFTLLAGDHFGSATGTYGLHVQRLNNPGDTTSLEFGDTVTNTITLPSEMFAYTFTGIENDVVDMRMIGTSSEIRLYRPDGTLLCSYWASYGLAETACTLDVSGTFTILAGDHFGFATDTYELHVQRLIIRKS